MLTELTTGLDLGVGGGKDESRNVLGWVDGEEVLRMGELRARPSHWKKAGCDI